MKALWIIAAVGTLVVSPCQSDGADPAPAPAAAAAEQHVTIYGAVMRQGRYEFKQGMTVKDALKMAGGAKENAKPNKLKLVRKMDTGETMSIHLNLEIPKHDLPLKPGDVIIADEKLGPDF